VKKEGKRGGETPRLHSPGGKSLPFFSIYKRGKGPLGAGKRKKKKKRGGVGWSRRETFTSTLSQPKEKLVF